MKTLLLLNVLATSEIEQSDKDFLFFIVTFVIAGIFSLIAFLILHKLPCRYGKIHDWERISGKLGSFKDSGFTFHYYYNSVYRCKKCGKTEKE